MSLIDHIILFWRALGVVRKFAAALGSMLALILFVAAIGFVALHVLEQKAGDIVADSMRMQRLALEVDSRLQLARQAERDFVQRLDALGVEAARNAYAVEFTERIGEARRNVTWLQDMERFSAGRRDRSQSAARLVEMHNAIDAYARHFRTMADQVLMAGGRTPTLGRDTVILDGDYLRLSSLVRQLALAATDAAQSAHEAIARYSRLVKYGLVISVLFALLLAGSIIHVLNRTVAKNVVRLSDAATELSLGNLEARARVQGQDEFGQLGHSLNAMAERMTRLVNELESQADMASDRLVEAIDSISEGFALYDHRGRLVLANERIREDGERHGVRMHEGDHIEDVLRQLAEKGAYVNALGREEAWVQEHMALFRTAGTEVEELMDDGTWVAINIFRTGRGESVVLVSDITDHKRHDMDMASMTSDLEDLVRQRTRVLVEKAMELRQANRRLMELDKLKSSFLSSVSHELRTPLTSLLGFSKLIKRDFSRIFLPLARDEEQTRLGNRIGTNLDIIGSEGERLTRLINDVLDLSRIESGREQWRFMEIDPAEIVNSAMESASGLFSAKPEVRLVVRRFDRVPAVHFDPDRLLQVLINLLSNAAKFTDAGSVSLDLYQDPKGRVRICVEDTGCGIRPEHQEDIFDKFHQVQQGDTLTHKPSGTGLGLAICRQIVGHYGGTIWAESERGRGTAMHVSLPVAIPPGRPQVLVVDDDPAARDHLSMTLKRAGYGVRTASGGEEALERAALNPPALISMDLFMPGMDGRTAIARLKEDRNLASIPVLVVSALGGEHSGLGDAVLLKPIDGDAYVDAVSALLGEGAKCRPMLALGGGDDAGAGPGWEQVTACSSSDLLDRLDRGFAGTVLVPLARAAEVDLDHICSLPGVQVMLLPDGPGGGGAAPGTLS